MTSDDLDLDALDQRVQRGLQPRAPETTPPARVLADLRPRFRRARRRRQAVLAGSSLAGGAALVAVVVALAGPPLSDRSNAPIAPGGGSTLGPATSTSTPSTSAPDDPARTSAAEPTPATSGTVPPATAPSASTASGPTTTTFSSAGGSVTVRNAGGSLSLVSSTPAGGFTADVRETGPTRVEVRFTGSGTEWRIRVEVRGGVAVPEITQHG